MGGLKQLRGEIDNIDANIIRALNKRSEIILEIRNVKKKSGKGIYAPEREEEVIRRIKENNRGPISDAALEAIYREVMSSALSLEKSLRIAYLGPEASFTHLAAIKKFGSQLEYMLCNSIADVFGEVEKENADYGVVPVENSIEGAVTHTMDMLIDSDLKICSQAIMNIQHNLLSLYPKNKITKIYSNAQVFGQCRLWLQSNLPGVEMVDVSSTSRAAQIAQQEKNSACIASLFAAAVYKLKIIAKDIEDSPNNVTRFLILGRQSSPLTGKDKTSVVFSIKDKVGALHGMLAPFKKYKINLTKIESRPSKKKTWDYYFFIDLEGHTQEKKVAKALKELEDKAKFFKVLGSYPDNSL